MTKFTVHLPITEPEQHPGYRFQCHFALDGDLAAKAKDFCRTHGISHQRLIERAIAYALENADA